MKKYLVNYQEIRKGLLPLEHTMTEYAENKKELREYFKMMYGRGFKIIKITGGIIMCEYCEGENRKPLMKNNLGNYYVVINPFNYLEDSVIGNSVDYSLFGEKINYCPICGRKLNKERLVNWLDLDQNI